MDWAGTQMNLGIALSAQASASEGHDRRRLLEEAIVAYEKSIEVFTIDLDRQRHTLMMAEINRLRAEIDELKAESRPI